MSADRQQPPPLVSRANRIVAAGCVAFLASMVGMAYASAPFYRVFCQLTGYGGTTRRVEQVSNTMLDRDISIRFDANTNGVPWEFEPKQRSMSIKIGETVQAEFRAKNLFGTATRGRATFNVTPELAGSYFNKVQCFCFTDTVLKPGESLDMPVVFYVDPDIVKDPDLKDIRTITLSYTFFPLDEPAPVIGADAAKDANQKLGG